LSEGWLANKNVTMHTLYAHPILPLFKTIVQESVVGFQHYHQVKPPAHNERLVSVLSKKLWLTLLLTVKHSSGTSKNSAPPFWEKITAMVVNYSATYCKYLFKRVTNLQHKTSSVYQVAVATRYVCC